MSTEIPATVNADEVTSWSDDVDVVVVGFGIAGGCAAVSAAAAGRERAGARTRGGSRRHLVDGRRSLLPRRRNRGPAGHRARRLGRGDVQVPGRGVPRARARQDPRLLRRQRRALQLAGGLGLSVRAQLLPRQGGRPARHRGAVVHRQREGVAVLRAGDTRAARTLGAGARRTGWRVDGHRPAAQAGRRARGADPLRDRRDQPRRRRRCGGRRRVEALHRNRCGQGEFGDHRRRRLRDEPRDGRRAHPGAGPAAAHQAPRPGRALHPGQPQRRRSRHPARRLGRRRRQAPGPAVHHRRRLPAGDPAHRRHRQQGRASGSSPRIPTIRALRLSCWSSRIRRRT